MAVLLLAEVNNGELALDATAKAVTAARALGDVTVLAAGGSAAAAGEAAARSTVWPRFWLPKTLPGPPPGRTDRRADRQPGRRL